MGHAVKGASQTYGTFALVIGLLSWIYLAAHITLLAAEAWEAATTELGIAAPPSSRRANVVIRGLDLADTLGKRLFSDYHGGQVRLPLVGALVTNSHMPRGLARGLHRLGRAYLHVSPGIGTSNSPCRRPVIAAVK